VNIWHLAIFFLLWLAPAKAQDFLPRRSLQLTAGSSLNPAFNGLVAYWNLNESQGYRLDITCNGWTAKEDPTTTTLSRSAGILNFAVTNHGNGATTSSGLQVSQNLDTRSQTSPFSVQFWYYPINFNTGAGLIGPLQSAGTQGWVIYTANNGGLHFYSTDDASTASDNAFTGTLLSLNTWTHLVLTWDGTKKNIFFNGVGSPKQALSAGSGISRGHHPFEIGNYYLLAAGVPGAIDEIGYWNRELSTNEVQTLYNSGAGLAMTPGNCYLTDAPTLTLTGGAPSCHYQASGYTDFYFTVDGSTPNPASVGHECDSSNCGDVDGFSGTLHITSTGTWGDSTGITIKMVGSNDGVHFSNQLTFLTTTDCHLP
jgi:concanavalin A-like lectin/glucanase superfamily protein